MVTSAAPATGTARAPDCFLRGLGRLGESYWANQSLTGLLHRWFGRRALRVDTATVQAANETRALKYLAPIATPEACDALVHHLLPQAAWPRKIERLYKRPFQ